MGTPGVPLIPPSKDEIVKVLRKYGGRLTKVAKHFEFCYTSLRKLIDPDPELVKLVAELRQSYDENLCDTAEDVLTYAMNQHKTDLTNSLKSTFYVLNNKGLMRGYKPNPARISIEEPTDGVIEAVQEINTGSRVTLTCRSDVAPEQLVLDQKQPGTKGAVQAELGTESSLDRFFSV